MLIWGNLCLAAIMLCSPHNWNYRQGPIP
jgi:hypothetical protein